jgi:hypothetical protein
MVGVKITNRIGVRQRKCQAPVVVAATPRDGWHRALHEPKSAPGVTATATPIRDRIRQSPDNLPGHVSGPSTSRSPVYLYQSHQCVSTIAFYTCDRMHSRTRTYHVAVVWLK